MGAVKEMGGEIERKSCIKQVVRKGRWGLVKCFLLSRVTLMSESISESVSDGIGDIC